MDLADDAGLGVPPPAGEVDDAVTVDGVGGIAGLDRGGTPGGVGGRHRTGGRDRHEDRGEHRGGDG